MNIQLLIIDPQNDFCDIEGAALPVVGANADMLRLADLINSFGAALDGITVTMDSHPSVAVERTTFWQTQEGHSVAPFTFITRQDVANQSVLPREPSHTTRVVQMLEQLEQKGKLGLVVWPVHCVTGTWGHNIHSAVVQELQRWEFARQRVVRKVLKGEYPLSEHFGVFEADAPVPGVEATQFNTALAAALTQGVDYLIIAGEASSHCVAASVDQLLRYCETTGAKTPQMVLLDDCMSPVAGFESDADQFFARAQAQGVQRMRKEHVGQLLPRLQAHA